MDGCLAEILGTLPERLASCREDELTHPDDLGAEGAEGRGATFTFTLPPPAAAAEEAPGPV